MHQITGSPVKRETVANWCNENPYSRRLIAELEGRAVGKVTLDTAYPPYAELVNLMVHPDYRRRGVANTLVQGCLEDACTRGHPYILLMTEHDNIPAISLYTSNGFLPCIPGSPAERAFTWMIHLPENSFTANINSKEDPVKYTPPRNKTQFHGRPLYQMHWTNLNTGNDLRLFLEGQPGQPMQGGTAPRITGSSFKAGAKAVDLLITEEKKTNQVSKETSFELMIQNNGQQELTLEGIDLLIPGGVEILEEPHPRKIEPGEETRTKFNVRLTPNFKVPILSFATVLLTCRTRIRGIETLMMVTAGFERS